VRVGPTDQRRGGNRGWGSRALGFSWKNHPPNSEYAGCPCVAEVPDSPTVRFPREICVSHGACWDPRLWIQVFQACLGKCPVAGTANRDEQQSLFHSLGSKNATTLNIASCAALIALVLPNLLDSTQSPIVPAEKLHSNPHAMDDTERRAKRSRFDQTEPEPRRSRFDRRSRSPPARKPDSGRDRERSPLSRSRDTPADSKSPPIDPAAAAGKLPSKPPVRSLGPRC
jgi:hypothetical protein